MLRRLCLVSLIALAIAAAGNAAPITSIGGANYFVKGVEPLNTPSSAFTFGTVGQVTTFSDGTNATTLLGADTASASSFGLTLANLNASGSGTAILTDADFIGNTLTISFPTNAFAAQGSELTFQFLSPSFAAITLDAGSLTIDGRVRLLSNDTGVDFGPTFGEWTFRPVVSSPGVPPFTVAAGQPGALTINTPTPSVAFTLASTGRIVDISGNPIPEPATIVSVGMAAVIGGYVSRRRLRAKGDTVVAG